MASPRSSFTALGKLLDAAREPVYVLDHDGSLVYLNPACAAWAGCDVQELLGRRCRYHSSPEVAGPSAVAAALCPPPQAFQGQVCTVELASPAEGAAAHTASFFPLGAGETPALIVAWLAPLDADDQSRRPADLSATEAAQLHQRLRRFRGILRSRRHLDRFLGASPLMAQVRAQIELAAGANASVLVLGPPGSGREQVAQAIHYHAEVEELGRYIPLSCALLDAELLGSTIAALLRRPAIGKRETLALNDVDQLPPAEQRELRDRLAGKFATLRIVSTARTPLSELARRGEYREDLAVALSTMTILLPPLGERPEDVPLLAQRTIEELNVKATRQIFGFTVEAMDQLTLYPWPGDVAELTLLVRQCHATAAASEITPADLPRQIYRAAEAEALPRPSEQPIDLEAFLAGVEQEVITRALRQAKGNKTKAAKLLGMTRPRLYRRLVQLGLESESDDRRPEPE